MGPPRRNPSHVTTQKTPSNVNLEPPLSPVARQPSVPAKQPNLGMTPASRYQHNLKVLRRRDPSIVSIFDQFSHVCLYHHNGTKWEKQGYEGSMFLYERESYPPYGFYILNRMGMDDHIQRLYPEDSIGAHGSYLIIRSYPEFTDRRLALARSSQPNGTPHKFSDVYAMPNVDKLTAAEKGESYTIGLWMFATDSREPLIDIFTRLHSYIKKNQPYPQEFRYGPDRPPPSIPSSTAAIANAPVHSNGTSQTLQSHPTSPMSPSRPEHQQGHFQARHPSQTCTNGGASELDKLFAKIDSVPASTSTTAQLPSSTSKMTVESLFAALGGGDLMETADHLTTPSASLSSFPSSSSTGISLLDSIFASANSLQPATTQPATPGSTTTSTSTNAITIHTPAPTTNPPPQVLNQDVISTLLGLPPSRSASVASTAYSSGAQSHPSSREGDNERGGSDGYSESSTVLDPDAEYDDELQAAGASAGRPLLADYGNGPAANGHGHGRGAHHRTQIHGDATPRPPVNGFITPPFTSRPPRFPSAPSSNANAIVAPPQSSYSRTQTQTQTPASTPSTARPLVPFEPDSELWPYPRADEAVAHDGDADGEEILELDFADTSALSDLDTFQRAMQNGSRGMHIHRRVESRGENGATAVERQERGKGPRKKGRKDRAAEREAIERSWDVPLNGSGTSSMGRYDVDRGREEEGLLSTASPSPCPSPTVPMQQVNGVASKVTQVKPERQQGVVADAVRESLIAAVSSKRLSAQTLERNDFVREVLTLIHTDKAFVDTLFREYTNRVG